jgi:hypothetical protein
LLRTKFLEAPSDLDWFMMAPAAQPLRRALLFCDDHSARQRRRS